MIFVSDKMIVKHTLDAEEALVEIPLRITFEYALQDQRFMPGTMERKVLYNLGPVLRRFNTVLR